MRKLFNFGKFVFFNKWLIFIFIWLYQKFISSQVEQAWGLYTKSLVKKCPKSTRFYGRSMITNPSKLMIGEFARVGRNCFLFCDGGLFIGDGTILSRNITIYTGNHNIDGAAVPYDKSYVYKPVVIGCGVWIGMNVSITPGVTIGDGAIIGMGSVISKDVKPGEVVVGAKQRVVAERDLVKFESLFEKEQLFARLWPDA